MDAELLVIGAGPYGLATAHAARARGIRTVLVGSPMAFWREHMPPGMLLRSGADWHFDAAGELTFVRFLDERGIAAADVDPIPLALYVDYADWFQAEAGLTARDERVASLRRTAGGFTATLTTGATLHARAVVAAPGIEHFTHRPDWADAVPGEHTCDLVDLTSLSGARVLIVGGRQSAYEWAALAAEHGAERVDVVHRHAAPRLAPVSWAFTNPYIAATLTEPGWWRKLPAAERAAIGRRFWEVGRLTLEPWLAPRLDRPEVHVHERAEVVDTAGPVELSTGACLHADRIVFACGYRADLARVPYLAGVLDELELANGFPVLDEAMQTTVPGLYIPGFPATQDFGPFFGFVRGVPVAATLIARDLAQ